MISVDFGFECKFEDSYICGYATEGNRFIWTQVGGWNVSDRIGPTSDHKGSVLGKVDVMSKTFFYSIIWRLLRDETHASWVKV